MLPHRHGGALKQPKAAYIMCIFVLAAMMVAGFGWTILLRVFPTVSERSGTNALGKILDSERMRDAADAERPLRPSEERRSDLSESAIRARAKAAVLGAFMADAATMSLHWIYDPARINSMLDGGKKDPAFFDPPSSPFYKLPLGSLSPYGDEALPTLHSIADQGGVKGAAMTEALVAALTRSRGYVNSATRQLIDNVNAGRKYPDASPADDQAHSLVKVPAVVARYAGLPELREKVVEASRSHQKGKAAEDYAVAMAVILEAVVLGKTISQAVAGYLESPDAAVGPALRAAVGAPVSDVPGIVQAVQDFGASCHLPGSFQGPIVAALRSRDYTGAVRANILAGGDQASRAHGVGALWAAQEGLAAIPADWVAKVPGYGEVEALVDRVLAQRPPE